MAISKAEQDKIRKEWLDVCAKALEDAGYVLCGYWASNSFSGEIVSADGEEGYIQIKAIIPKGDRSGEPWDGNEEAKAYAVKVENDRIKAQKKAEEKAKKIAKDKKAREKKAEEEEK